MEQTVNLAESRSRPSESPVATSVAGRGPPPPGARYVAIVNPVSGRYSQAAAVRQVAEYLRGRGCRFETFLTRGPGDAGHLAANLPGNTRAVLAVGGDGTAREVAAALIGREIPLVILRGGTENLLAKDLDMPTEPRSVAETLMAGEPFRTDVGLAEGLRFFVVAGVGFDAEVVARLTRRRVGHISHLHYLDPIWRAFWTHAFPELDIKADGATAYCGPGLAIVSVLPRYGVGLRINPGACRDDGLLDLCVLPCASRARLLRHAVSVMLGRNAEANGAIRRRASVIRITSPDPVPVQLDGDLAGALPLTLTVAPRAALFLRPPAGMNSPAEKTNG